MLIFTAQEIREALGCEVILGGSSAVCRAGWSTQLQLMPEILTRGTPQSNISGARLRPRKLEAFDRLSHWLCPPQQEIDCPMLLPEMAIADALVDRASGGQTHIYDPDDLDPDEIPEGAADPVLAGPWRIWDGRSTVQAKPRLTWRCCAGRHPSRLDDTFGCRSNTVKTEKLY